MDHSVTPHHPVIFIGGTGRSGTNITKAIFAQHPKVGTLPFEHRFVIDPDGVVDFYNSYAGAWSPYMADKKIKRLEQFLLYLAHRDPIETAFSQRVKAFDRFH